MPLLPVANIAPKTWRHRIDAQAANRDVLTLARQFELSALEDRVGRAEFETPSFRSTTSNKPIFLFHEIDQQVLTHFVLTQSLQVLLCPLGTDFDGPKDWDILGL